MKKFALLVLRMMALAAMPCVAFAGNTCSVATTAVAFGSYNVLSPTDTTSTGNVRVTCNSNNPGTIPSDILIGTGSAGGAWATSRRMTGTPDILNYQIYRDSARTVVWNAVTPYTNPVITIVQANVAVFIDVPVYGRILNQQNVGVSSYADSLNVIVSW